MLRCSAGSRFNLRLGRQRRSKEPMLRAAVRQRAQLASHREGAIRFDVGLHVSRQYLPHHAEQQRFAGHDVIRLYTFEGNEQAISFYLRNGWNETHSDKGAAHGALLGDFSRNG